MFGLIHWEFFRVKPDHSVFVFVLDIRITWYRRHNMYLGFITSESQIGETFFCLLMLGKKDTFDRKLGGVFSRFILGQQIRV